MAKKRKSRIRQTRTEWQKVFDPHPGMIQSFSWPDRIPELIHISIALIEYDYNKVQEDFRRVADYVNSKHPLARKFHFNFSHTIKLIKEDGSILDEIFKTCFKSAFELLITFYRYFDLELDFKPKVNPKLLLIGYHKILDGRSDSSLIAKYLMMQYDQSGRPDPFNLFNKNTKEEILEPMNVSSIMATFPITIGQSEYLDLNFCQDIWMYNYLYSPLMQKPDDSKEEEEHFKEMQVEEFTQEFIELYSQFKEVNLLAIYPTYIAEVNMGFVSRICNLTLDTVDFVKSHKGEIAELVFRTVLESFIVGSWLLKKKDVELHQRFRDFSTGRQKFFGDKIFEKATDERVKEEAKKMVNDSIKESGMRDIEVATERGDIFDLPISKMADEVWGEDNQYYFLYKRASEVTHGQWRVIAKYHLAKSINPMHNGLYWYNDNPNRFAGLVPAFTCLGFATDFLITIINDIESEETKELSTKLNDYHKRLFAGWMKYYNKYIIGTDNIK